MRNVRIFLFDRLPVKAWGCLLALLVTATSFLPPELKVQLHTRGPLHAWGHLYAFALICTLLTAGVRSRGRSAVMALATVLLALAIEAAQAHLRLAALELPDLAFDGAGVLFGLLFSSLRSQLEREPESLRLTQEQNLRGIRG